MALVHLATAAARGDGAKRAGDTKQPTDFDVGEIPGCGDVLHINLTVCGTNILRANRAALKQR